MPASAPCRLAVLVVIDLDPDAQRRRDRRRVEPQLGCILGQRSPEVPVGTGSLVA
jgi:hypothetical protein